MNITLITVSEFNEMMLKSDAQKSLFTLYCTPFLLLILLIYYLALTGSPIVLQFQTCVLHKRKLSSDNQKERTRRSREQHMPMEECGL